MLTRFVSLAVFLCTLPAAFAADVPIEAKPEWKTFFDSRHLQGTVMIYDVQQDKWSAYNPERAVQGLLPASTFKIPNSIAALDSGVAKDERQVFKWDGVKRTMMAEWNQDLTLWQAYRFSCVPVYQEIARQIGEKRMAEYVKKFQYGNEDIGGGIDQFWLHGALRISARQEIEFLRKVRARTLPVSERSQLIVTDMMVDEATPDYVIRGKTGWAQPTPESGVGWWVGWVETKGNRTAFFALNVTITNEDQLPARKAIVKEVLKTAGYIP